ncbi:MAG TPA: hypothetical protein VHS78_15720 [Candidatus Elarobacter sp.]|jgi:hypothetical protein|nr:hypothetical protein [Candidatus Elarobacter sp.]
MFQRAALCLVVASLFLAGCSNVRNEAVTSSNKDQVVADVAKSAMSDDDKKAFIGASMRSALGNYTLEGKTVAQIVDEQKKWQAEQDAQAAAAHEAQLKAEAKKAALIAAMAHAVSVQPVSKRFRASDFESGNYDDEEYVTVQVHNIGTKSVKGVKGTLRFTNSFGDKVIALDIEVGGVGGEAVTLRPGGVDTTELGWHYNSFEREWNIFRNTALSGMKAQWVPKIILFADGSTLKASDDDAG